MDDEPAIFPTLRLVPEIGMGAAEFRRPRKRQRVILEFARYIVSAGLLVFGTPVGVNR
jgi:hypothetical protein